MTRMVAWLGGAAFVASLGYTVYLYGVVLGDPFPAAPSPFGFAVAINLALFAAFAVHHSLFARDAVKHWVARVVSASLERSLYVWTSSALLVAVCAYWRPIIGLVYRIDGPVRWLLYGVQLCGVYLTARGAGVIDPLELAGIRQAQRKRENVVFRSDGPFGLVRHPIYLGWLFMTFAAPSMTVNRLLFAAITSAYLVVAIPWEESALVKAFGDRYRAYQAAVRWRLIPGLW